MKRLFLSALLSLSLAPTVPAIVDTNNNGLSDLWEKDNNAGKLFPANFDPQADPDADGWTNAQEASAGTDPFDPNPPNGLICPKIVHIPAVFGAPYENGTPVVITPEGVRVTWPSLVGKQYILQVSPDLTEGSWKPVDSPFVGNGSEITYNSKIRQSDKCFWRVQAEDTDTDSDGLTDAEENELGTSSLFADTNDDGIDDAMAVAMGSKPTGDTADADSDGVPDNCYYSVEFEFEYETHYNSPPEPSFYTDREDLNARYFTREWAFDFSVKDSPRYAGITDGKYLRKTTVMGDGVLLMDGSEIATEEGDCLEPWLSRHKLTLA